MPWPIRFGPPPSTITFLRSVGRASHSSSYVEYMYAVRVSNSAAQVSTRLYTGRTFSSQRLARTASWVAFSSFASLRSEKPARLSIHSASRSRSPIRLPASAFSWRMRSSICARNQGSIRVSWCTSSRLIPMRSASATKRMRSGPASASSFSMVSRSAVLSSNPSMPVSSPRSAFCTDSWNVRPIAMTSPTDFIWVVSRESACGNFSKAKRGILVTT